MYDTSAAYKEALNNNIQHWAMAGTLYVTRVVEGEKVQATYNLTGDNILEGSLSIDCQGGDENSITFGAVYASSLECTLCRLPEEIELGDFSESAITLSTYLEGEALPLGIYTIADAKWTLEGVAITAYDNISKLDVPFNIGNSTSSATKTAYHWYIAACTAAGLTPGTSESDFALMCNGQSSLSLYSGDGVKVTTHPEGVDTWRDLMFYLCQVTGSIAAIDRFGRLSVVPYRLADGVKPLVTQINLNNAVSGSVEISDKAIKLSGMKLEDASGDVKYYGYNVEENNKLLLAYEEKYMEVQEERNNKLLQIDLLEEENRHLYDQYQAGRITRNEYEAQSTTNDQQIMTYSLQVEVINTVTLPNLDTTMIWLQNHSDPFYDDAKYIEFGYNPFMGASWSSTPTSPGEAEKWRLAGLITDLDYYNFTGEIIGNNGVDIGDRVSLFIQGMPIVQALIGGYTYDGYTLSLRGFGGDSQLQAVKSKRDTSARSSIGTLSEQVKALQTSMDSVSDKVSDGKQMLASAITDKGVNTLPDASYKTMADHIRMIETESGDDTSIWLPIEYGFIEHEAIEVLLEDYEYDDTDPYYYFPEVTFTND